jgi:succinoglycan biosynthesis transport protein ExoP
MMPDSPKPEFDRPRRPFREEPLVEEPSSINVDDLIHIAFCHKWKIIIMSLLGVAGAAAAFLAWPAQFFSEAKILIRYVVEARPVTAVGPAEADQLKSPDARGDAIINSEIEIMTSRDLCEQVAEAVGPDKILQGQKVQGDPKVAAGGMIENNLNVEIARKSSVVRLLFKHPDPAIARLVLGSLTTNYLQKHVDIHRSVGVYDPFLLTKTEELQAELQRIENQIRTLKTNYGVVSFDEAKRAYTAQFAKVNEERYAAEAELASLLAVAASEHKTNSQPAASTNQSDVATATNVVAVAPDLRSPEFTAKAAKYRDLTAKLSGLEIREMEMIPLYTDEHQPLRNLRSQIAEIKKQKEAMEKETPALLLTPAIPVTAQGTPIYPLLATGADSNKIVSLQAKMTVLTNQLQRLKIAATDIDMAETEYLNLMRKKELNETSLKKYADSLERSRIEKNLGPGNVSNIGIVQAASPPVIDAGKKMKVVGGILAFGILGGLGWAFLLEMVLSPAIKRPADVKNKLKMPLFIWIPEIIKNSTNGHSRRSEIRGQRSEVKELPEPAETPGVGNTETPPHRSTESVPSALSTGHRPSATGLEIAPWDPHHDMRNYFETLRDRLINYFEIKNMTHKPKLVAVTSCSQGAGVSTIAAGLAALFSETGDGNVLLVDMNLDQGAAAAHHFFRGKPGCGLVEALQQEKRESAMVQENLYVASVGDGNGKLSALMPKKFSNLVPRMKASDYDYIIFDMPPVSQTSITTRLARQMDINLLVIEAETDATSKIQEAVAMFKEAQANVGGVLNRRQFHVPRKLSHEL